MLHLNYSNRTESLVECLARRIKTEQEGDALGGAWAASLLVVPNPFMKGYLRQQLALRNGIAANLRFTYLNGLWSELFRGGKARILTSDSLRIGLMQAMASPSIMALEALAPVRHYLKGESGGLKLAQFATELARVFEEYHHSRPEWIRHWRRNEPAPGADEATEGWQRALWRAAVAALDGAEGGHATLGEIVASGQIRQHQLPAALHLFGFSHVAQVYHDLYEALGSLESTDLHLYALNPCAEFWEDLETESERARRDRPRRDEAKLGHDRLRPDTDADLAEEQDFYDLTSSSGPEALRRWGRPGRENIRLLNEISGFTFQPAFAPAEPDTRLADLQNDILLFQDPQVRDRPLDDSIRFLAAPSPRREAEIVATEIWRLMEAHAGTAQPLRFSDIAVIVPPSEQRAYLAHLQAAFQETHRIPWVEGDGVSPAMRRLLEAIEVLLELPTSGLTRAAVLRVLAQPALQATFGDLDLSAWTRWCEELGIVRGLDREAWRGTYVDRDALHWDQGLKRLALGRFMLDEGAWEEEGETYRSLPAADADSAGRFLALVRRLTADADELRSAQLDLFAWVERLEAFLGRWLEADDEATLKALERLRAGLGALTEQGRAAKELPKLDFPAARYLALEAIAGLKAQAAATLSRGVVVSSYTPMRAIPFRATFLMGLGEGVFPTRETRSALDMRAKCRHAGDVTQTEKECYLFLETVLSTREHLVLSHVALDEASGERKEASGLFKEFRNLVGRYLPESCQPKEGQDPLLETHPLHRFDPAYFPDWFPAEGSPKDLKSYAPIAAAEARAVWMREQLAAGRPLALPFALGKLPVAETVQAELRARLGTEAVSAAWTPEATLRVSLSDLKTWLECPLTGAARVRAGLRNGETQDLAAVEHEPFASEMLDTWSLVRAVTLEAVREEVDPERVYDAQVARLQARAGTPFGLFAEREKADNLASIHGWVELFRAKGERPESWRFGPSGSRGRVAEQVRPALVLEVPFGDRSVRVELVGELREQCGGSLFLERGACQKKPDAKLLKKALGAFLDHLLLTLAEPGHGAHAARFVFTEPAGAKTPLQELSIPFPALGPELAMAILLGWLQDLLSGDHGVLLPLEAVLDLEGQVDPAAISEWVEEQLDAGTRGMFSTRYGPVPDPTRYAPPSDPQALVERRLRPFLDALFAPAGEA